MSTLVADILFILLAIILVFGAYATVTSYRKLKTNNYSTLTNKEAQNYSAFRFLAPILAVMGVGGFNEYIKTPLVIQSCQKVSKCFPAHHFSFAAFTFSLALASLVLTVVCWRTDRARRDLGIKIDWTSG